MDRQKKRRQSRAQAVAEAKALVRDEKALRLRELGKTYKQISDELKYGSEGNARRAVHRRMKRLRETVAEAAEEVRQLELRRLDAMLAGVMKKANKGDVQSIASVLRIMERRTAYEGLDVPKALQVELTRNIDALLERVKRVVAGDVYERILAAAAGVDGAPEAGAAEGGEIAGGGEKGDEPG